MWAWASDCPDRPVLTDANATTISAAVLAERVLSLATQLRSYRIGPGDKLLVAGTDLATTLEVAMACSLAGVDIVPVRPPDHADPRVAELIEHRVAVAIVTPDVAGHLALPSLRMAEVAAPDRVLWFSQRQATRGDASIESVAGRVLSIDDALAERSSERVTPATLATTLALSVDILGFTRDGIALYLLPHLRPRTLELALGLLHARRRVVVPAEPQFEAVRQTIASHAVSDVVASSKLTRQLLAAGVAESADNVRFIAVGSVTEAVTAPQLVQAGPDRRHVEALVAPAPSGLAGYWSWSRHDPYRPAIVTDGDEPLAAGALLNRVEQVAARITGDGSSPVVATCFARGEDVITVALAASLAGARLVPIAPDATAQDVTHLIGASGAEMLVTDQQMPVAVSAAAQVLDASGVLVTTLAGLCMMDEKSGGTGVAGGVLPYTSGTTGRPKIVRHPVSRWSPEMRASADRAWISRFGVEGTGTHLVTCPVHQMATLNYAIMALHAGQTLLLMPKWQPRRALELIEEYAVTSARMVPSMFESLLALPEAVRRHRPASLRAVIHGAAPCSMAVKQAMFDWWGPVLYESYSSVELNGTYVTPEEWLARPGTVGKPMPGVEVRVLDEDGRSCRPGVEGTVYVTSRDVRYDDDSIPSTTDDGLATVGDVGLLDAEGWLFLSGRQTDYISVGGAKFHPSEVEAVLRDAPGVTDCGVVGISQRRLGQVVAAAVVLAHPRRDERALYAELLAFARARLPITKVPQRILAVAALPRDGYGKLRRRELQRMLGDHTGEPAGAAASKARSRGR